MFALETSVYRKKHRNHGANLSTLSAKCPLHFSILCRSTPLAPAEYFDGLYSERLEAYCTAGLSAETAVSGAHYSNCSNLSIRICKLFWSSEKITMPLNSPISNGCLGCLTTADTSKAFDSVQHPRLLEKLAWYGIQDHWFSNWLENRIQKTRGGEKSLAITHGVVQGSLLGPMLFLIFTNDLPSYLEDSKIVMYADDVQFLHQGKVQHILDLQSRVELTVNAAHRWFIANSLKINPAKTDLVLVKSKKRHLSHDFRVKFNEAKIHPSPSAKVLGVTVHSNLTFEAHISSVIRRCYATMGSLAKLARSLPEEVKKMIIEALVFPHLAYCTDSLCRMRDNSEASNSKGH